MIEVTSSISIDEREIQVDFVRSSGPGGQNVNKVATAVQLRFDVRGSPSLPDALKERLAKLAGSRMTEDGVLVIDARRYRTQEQNKADALARLADLVGRAATPPRPRKQTRPSRAARQERLDTKRQRSSVKKMRRQVEED